MVNELDPVSWGVIGTADIALRKVIPAMQMSEVSRVDAIASRTEHRAAEAAARLGIPKWYGSYEQLLADPSIEAVYIPLPNHVHAEWTIAAAGAGKHVLCEKPLALTSADVSRMAERCSAEGVKLMEAFMYRLHPMWVEVRRLIDDGAIGAVRSIESVFTYFNEDPEDIRNKVEAGGGTLYDIGCYPINVARMLFGSEPTVVGATIQRDSRFGTDVVTSALLEFDGGHASFMCSTQLEPDQRVSIHGTDGRLVVEIPFNIPPDRATRILQYAGGEPPEAPGIEIHEIPPANQYAVQADAFSTAVRLDAEVPTPIEDALGNIEVIESIFAQART